MHNRLRCLLGVACVFGSACQGSEGGQTVLVHEVDGYQQAWERYRASARSAPGGGLVVEGDLFFASEEELREYFDERTAEDADKAHAIQRTTDGFVPSFEFPANTNIRYCVSDAFAPEKALWVTRLQDAMRAWESVVNVRFTYRAELDSSCSATTNDVEFAVVRNDGREAYCASNKMDFGFGCLVGTGMSAFGVLVIDTDLNVKFGGRTPNVTPTGVLRHELGHMLALRHEHPWRPGTISASCPETPTGLITGGLQLGTVDYERNSVMHYAFDDVFADCDGNTQSSYTITYEDGHSVQRLYGMHPAWVNLLLTGA